MEQIRNYCKELLEKILNSENGHLPLSYRVKLMRLINNPLLINKIMFECTKKVYPIWQNDYPNDNIFAGILHKCNEYLYNNIHSEKFFHSLGDDNKNYAESGDDSSSDAAIAIISLCYSIAGDAGDILRNKPDFDYNNENDNEFDADSWTTDFYASLAYSDGSPFINNGDIQKRKEFWEWFISMVMELVEYPNKPILSLPTIIGSKEVSNDNLYERTQMYNTPSIKESLSVLIEKTINLMKEESVVWEKIVLKSLNFHSGNLYETYFFNKSNIEEKFRKVDRDNIQLFSNIKKAMYAQKPEEGAWLQSYLTIFPNGKYEYKFNYDGNDTLDYFADDPDELLSEFEAFPRKKEFTPDWWQKILGRKAKYLK